MGTCNQPKKQPDVVRRALLDHGARLCAEGGVRCLTLQAVADSAGVTKGGLLHHFPTKQALVDAIFGELLCFFGTSLERLMADDPEPEGRFSRAYINATFELIAREDFVCRSALMMSSVTEA